MARTRCSSAVNTGVGVGTTTAGPVGPPGVVGVEVFVGVEVRVAVLTAVAVFVGVLDGRTLGPVPEGEVGVAEGVPGPGVGVFVG